MWCCTACEAAVLVDLTIRPGGAGVAAALLAFLSARKLTAQQKTGIGECRDPKQFLRWIRRAATVKKADELFVARQRH